jgi:hypothetical protein
MLIVTWLNKEGHVSTKFRFIAMLREAPPFQPALINLHFKLFCTKIYVYSNGSV